MFPYVNRIFVDSQFRRQAKRISCSYQGWVAPRSWGERESKSSHWSEQKSKECFQLDLLRFSLSSFEIKSESNKSI